MGQLEAAMLTGGVLLLIAAVVLTPLGMTWDSAALQGIGMISAVAGTIVVVTSSYVRTPRQGK